VSSDLSEGMAAMELVLSICLLTSPGDCREERISISMEQTAPMQCMIGAQPMIAEWTNTHPKWKVAKWRCGPAGFDGQRI
jgi:hypothetical protein